MLRFFCNTVRIFYGFVLLIHCATADGAMNGKVTELTKFPDALYSYSSQLPEHFNVYQKVSEDGIYIHFKIQHQNSAVKNDNLWRVLEGNLVKYDGSRMTAIQQILTTGENEFVWRSARANVGDFTGGYHGDERIDIDPGSKVTFYADGEKIAYSDDLPLTACASFYYHQFSTMHQSGTGGTDTRSADYTAIKGNPIDCYHEKRTVFENSGFTTYNKLTWATSTPIDKCYFGIFCVNKAISSEGINEDGKHTIFNNNGGKKLTSTKQKIIMKNEAFGSEIVCDATVIVTPFTPVLTTFIWDSNNYHKYYSEIKATHAYPGDVWETSASIKFSFK